MSGNETEALLRRARQFIDAHYDTELDLEQIAGQTGFSRFHFIRLFQRTFATTPHQYLTQRRLERARELLDSSELSVTEICFAVGFQSLGSFSTLFHRSTGQAPSLYRARVFQGFSLPRRFIPGCYGVVFGIPPLRRAN
ncbi:MAG TPA: AraC family transcriptional regulator [Herpetosiphonaceae bacterium]|nr:AraC family transcriptional regulator [Herpetosiphonaceae bacterium]